jgi:hypothetical protein
LTLLPVTAGAATAVWAESAERSAEDAAIFQNLIVNLSANLSRCTTTFGRRLEPKRLGTFNVICGKILRGKIFRGKILRCKIFSGMILFVAQRASFSSSGNGA